MKLGFMSSVCPQQTLSELFETARKYGYEGIELRVEWQHGHGVELGLSNAQQSKIRTAFGESGIKLTSLATGCRFQSEDKAKNTAEVEKLRKYIDLAAAVGAPLIRIFGDPVPAEAEKLDEALEREAEGINLLDALAGQQGVLLGLETHGNLLASQAAEVIVRAEARHCMILWHAEHHIRHGEPLDRAWAFVRPRVCHAHWRVNVPDIEEEKIAATFPLLKKMGFEGFVSLEDINPPDSDATLKLHADKYEQWCR